jgi:hypothetical protein
LLTGAEARDHGADTASPGQDGHPLAATVAAAFGLSGFERDLLVLCAGVELDGQLAGAWRCAVGVSDACPLTARDALRLLPGGGWSTFDRTAPLFRWHLLERADADTFAARPLRVSERVLLFLTGHNALDAALAPAFRPAVTAPLRAQEHAHAVEGCIRVVAETPGRALLLQWIGDDEAAQEDAAAGLARNFGLGLHVVDAGALPADPFDAAAFARRWEREAALLPSALLIDTHRAPIAAGARAAVEEMRGLVMASGRAPVTLRRPCHRCPIDRPDPNGQRGLWLASLGGEPTIAGPVEIDLLAGRFRFSATTIHQIALLGKATATVGAAPALQRLCRDESRRKIDELAERVEPAASWDDLVLPTSQRSVLRQIVAHAQHRMTVLHDWGFAAKSGRGLGTAVLFCGESGVGKTMACEVLARALDLDLYRVDLSAVVSKYIGETEKNLRQVFDAADQGGLLLLFDEADAIFGKRSEVKDSHDRHANIEIAYLLQRLESYAGVAVLTTNLRSALDTSFLRRLRFIVQFPFPEAAQREAIWRRTLPAALPMDGVNFAALAQVRLSGGQIRNAALNAAFLAADERKPLGMDHLLAAVHVEAAKSERSLTEADTRGWR